MAEISKREIIRTALVALGIVAFIGIAVAFSGGAAGGSGGGFVPSCH